MPVAEEIGTLEDSSALLGDAAGLRRRMREDGYLYLRGAGPADTILELRRAMLDICREAGWIDPSAGPLEARWSGAGPFTETEPPYMAVYRQIVHHPLFNQLPGDPFYLDLIGKLVEGPVMMHRMHIGRVSFPRNTAQTTPPHQDWNYIRGTPDTFTVWTPVGDCPRELGGLKVLRGSNRRGYIAHRLFPAPKYAGEGLGEAELAQTSGDRWLTADFQAGDCLVFHSHTVHAALPNLSQDQLRLSIDNRYQRQGDEHGPAATRTHHGL